MKTWERKKIDLKNIWTLVVAIVLFCTCFSALANKTPGNSALTIQNIQPLSVRSKGNVSILNENFSTGSMPPSGWTVINTHPNGRWTKDTRCHSSPYSASVHREKTWLGLQNESLITSSLDFKKYSATQIFLQFWWFTDVYAIINALLYFNVSLSTDGGTSWKKIWMAINQSGFPQYTFSLVGMPIDLTKYRNETNVKIKFQYFSNTTVGWQGQYFAIDDVVIWATVPTPGPTCSAGGPYAWWWYSQTQHMPQGVRFHGNVSKPYNPYLCHWLWDFGDGNTSQLPVTTWHFYRYIGNYTVKLQVTYGKNISWDNTTAHIYLIQPFNLTIKPKLISFGGIKADVKNPSDYNATNVSWTIKVFSLPFGLFEKIVASDTITNIRNHTTVLIKSKYFFGPGPIQIEFIVQPENTGGNDTRFFGIKFGPMIFTIPKGSMNL